MLRRQEVLRLYRKQLVEKETEEYTLEKSKEVNHGQPVGKNNQGRMDSMKFSNRSGIGMLDSQEGSPGSFENKAGGSGMRYVM